MMAVEVLDAEIGELVEQMPDPAIDKLELAAIERARHRDIAIGHAVLLAFAIGRMHALAGIIGKIVPDVIGRRVPRLVRIPGVDQREELVLVDLLQAFGCLHHGERCRAVHLARARIGLHLAGDRPLRELAFALALGLVGGAVGAVVRRSQQLGLHVVEEVEAAII